MSNIEALSVRAKKACRSLRDRGALGVEAALIEELAAMAGRVSPVEYEYGLLNPESPMRGALIDGAHLISKNREHIETQHRRGHPLIQFVRRVKAGEWEPVEATRKEQP